MIYTRHSSSARNECFIPLTLILNSEGTLHDEKCFLQYSCNARFPSFLHFVNYCDDERDERDGKPVGKVHHKSVGAKTFPSHRIAPCQTIMHDKPISKTLRIKFTSFEFYSIKDVKVLVFNKRRVSADCMRRSRKAL